jgi:hypothetical protein
MATAGVLEGESSNKTAPPSAGDSFSKIVSHSGSEHDGQDDEDEVVESDPTGAGLAALQLACQLVELHAGSGSGTGCRCSARASCPSLR